MLRELRAKSPVLSEMVRNKMDQIKEFIRSAAVYLLSITLWFLEKLNRFCYFLVAKISALLVVILVPYLIMYAAINLISNTSPEPLRIFAGWFLFIGLMGVLSAFLVSLGQLALWIRHTSIHYWKCRTLPMKSDSTIEGHPYSIDSISDEDKQETFTHIGNHIAIAVFLNSLGWSAVSLIDRTEFVTPSRIFSTFELVLQFLAVLFGGLPGIVGVAVTSSELYSILPGGDLLGSVYLLTVLIPALPLTIAAKNTAYLVEFLFHSYWRENHRVMVTIVTLYYSWVFIYFIYTFFPGIFPEVT